MPTPGAHVADNDLAFGQIVEAISKSRFWTNTCIFAIEDDPQDGWDHVSGYRTTAYVVSPYTKRGAVIKNNYNQTSMIRTMELILGLPPMNQLDATATPINIFRSEPDLRPYKALLPNVALDNLVTPPPRDAATAYWMRMSDEQDLEHADMADPDDVYQAWDEIHEMIGEDASVIPVTYNGEWRAMMRTLPSVYTAQHSSATTISRSPRSVLVPKVVPCPTTRYTPSTDTPAANQCTGRTRSFPIADESTATATGVTPTTPWCSPPFFPWQARSVGIHFRGILRTRRPTQRRLTFSPPSDPRTTIRSNRAWPVCSGRARSPGRGSPAAWRPLRSSS